MKFSNYLNIILEDLSSNTKSKIFLILFNGENILKNFMQYCLENNNFSFNEKELKKMLTYVLNNYNDSTKDYQIKTILKILDPYIENFININKINKSRSLNKNENIEAIINNF
jgi:hypothetical protein